MQRSSDSNSGLPSPLSLLLDADRESVEAEDVLLLSYNLDLGFFERTALGVSQALGARVTVVGDGGVVVHDPRAVRRAGRSYVSGLAACRGAFHPKLAVIAGEERSIVAVGSGNVTMAGWGSNHEIWTVLRGEPEGAPVTLQALADWLQTLASAVQLSDRLPETFDRIAGNLRRPPGVNPGPQLVTSTAGRIIDQLPEGPVDELAVFAPFHDLGAAALAALIDRFDPRRTTIAIQPELTVIDGPAVAALASERGASIVETDAARYRHGKLIEWVTGSRRWALTGSPNCSSAALLRSVAEGGNCELGLIDEVTASLMPEGAEMGAARVRSHAYVMRSEPTAGIVLLGATRVEKGIEVALARGAPKNAWVELSAVTAQPDTWEVIGEVPEGLARAALTWAAEGGGRLRVVAESEAAGRVASNVVFLLDPVRAARRPGHGIDRARVTEPFDLFRSTGLAETFVADLGGLRAGLPQRQGRPASSGSGGRGDGTWVDSYGSWDAYLDECAGRLGHTLINFALGLPDLTTAATTGAADILAAEWDEELPDEADAGLEDERAEQVAVDKDVAHETGIAAAIPSLSDQAAQVRNRYQRWVAQLADAAESFGPAERLVVVRLILWTAAANAWVRGDLAWIPLLGRAVRALASGDPPSEIEAQTGSLAAVALSVMRSHAPLTRWTVEGRAFDETVRVVEHVLPAADERYISEYTRLLEPAFGLAVHPKVVLDVCHVILEVDPFDAALLGVDELNMEVHRHGQAVHVEGEQTNPEVAALQALAMVEGFEPVAAWAGRQGNWALMMWRRPDVVVGRTDGGPTVWRHYVLGGLLTPHVIAATEKRIDTDYNVWTSFPGRPHHPIVEELLTATGVSLDVVPGCPESDVD